MTIGIKFTNNFSAPIAANISSSATTIALATGYGSLLPNYGVDEYEYITLTDSSNHIEIVKVTARSGDTLTVVRAQDNTVARAWTAGDRMSSRPCAAAMYDALQVNVAKADAVHSHAAGDVALTPTGSIAATNIQAAIAELDGDIAGKQAALGYTAAQAGANSDITSLTGLTTPLSVAQGGTGSATGAIPAGCVAHFAMNSAPAGWLAANGAAVSRTTYAALFAVIDTLYGVGDNSTTFNLPDLRGYFVRGAGTNADGVASGTFGAKQADELKSHTHTVRGGAGSGNSSADNMGLFDTFASNQASSATGGTETRPHNIALLACIKF
jgi:microcystin-dependent protein